MKTGMKHLPIASEIDVAMARIARAVLAHENGFNVVGRYYVVTSIAELASVILHDAGSGSIDLQILTDAEDERSLRIVAQRRGPGGESAASNIQEHHSTERGFRSRLRQIHRLMSELHLASGMSVGAVAQTMKRLNEHDHERTKLWKNWQPRLATTVRASVNGV